MPDTITRTPATTIAIAPIREADGFLTVIKYGDGYYDYTHHESLDEALDLYTEPRFGRGHAIHACKDGVPFAKLSAATILAVRRGPGGGIA